MSRTLADRFSELLTLKGAEAYEIVGRKAGVSSKTVRRWVKDGFPNSNAALRLAKALGCEQKEALKLALECFPGADRKSA